MHFSIIPPVFVLRNPKTGDVAAKIQLNFRKIGTFGWIFSTIDAFRKERHSNLIDNTLGDKWINTKYTYSYIVENLMSTHLCGGECIEDRNLLRTEKYQRNPDYIFASADTILRTFQSLSVANRTVNAESGKAYRFNVNEHAQRAAANLFRQAVRQIETLTARLLGSNHSPATPGGWGVVHCNLKKSHSATTSRLFNNPERAH